MRINHNIASLNTYGRLSSNNASVSKSLEKLSSGLRINRAGDDAAGLAISEKMRAQIRGLDQATRNSQDAISMIQTAEGSLNETHSILQRMRELAVQSSNDTNTDSDRAEIQKEINQLTSEINRIGNTTEFNTKKLLNGDVSNTLEVASLSVNGGASTASNGLTVRAEGTSLATGSHTLTVLKSAASKNIELISGDATYSNGTAAFANNTISFNATSLIGNGSLSNYTATLTFNSAAGGYNLAITSGAAVVTSEFVALGADYNNHGLHFKIDSTTQVDGDTITFTLSDTADQLGAKTVGYTVAGKSLSSIAKMSYDSTAEVGNYTVCWMAEGQWHVFNDEGTVDDIVSFAGTFSYNQHGLNLQFNSSEFDTAGDAFTFEVNPNTYYVKLDTGASQAVALGTSGISYQGLSIDVSSSLTGVTSGTISITVANVTTGSDDSLAFQIGANQNQSLSLDINDMRATKLNISTTTAGANFTATKSVTDGTNNTNTEYALDVSTVAGATNAITVIDDAIKQVSQERSKLGAYQNRLEHTINNLGTASENLTASESRIRDVDMAKEMMEYSKNNILTQAATAMLAQANQTPQGVLQLLR